MLGRDVSLLVGRLPNAQFEHLFFFLLLGCVVAVIGALHAAPSEWQSGAST